MPSTEPKLVNPCIRNCCLGEGDVCLGCFRTLAEILSWNKMNHAQQQETLARCRQRKQSKQSTFAFRFHPDAKTDKK